MVTAPMTSPATRLYLCESHYEPLAPGNQVMASPAMAHHLRRVLRLRVGAEVELFNGRDGCWQGELTQTTPATILTVRTLRTPPAPLLPVTLVFAPIKGPRQGGVIEKATELGVTTFQPVITQRTVAGFTPARFYDRAVAAAQQCGRSEIPILKEPLPLPYWCDQVTQETQEAHAVIACAEWGAAYPILDLCHIHAHHPVHFVIGPEGGFTHDERTILAQNPHTSFAGLGPRILRADTAALAALCAWQSVHDRRRPPAKQQGPYRNGEI